MSSWIKVKKRKKNYLTIAWAVQSTGTSWKDFGRGLSTSLPEHVTPISIKPVTSLENVSFELAAPVFESGPIVPSLIIVAWNLCVFRTDKTNCSASHFDWGYPPNLGGGTDACSNLVSETDPEKIPSVQMCTNLAPAS